MTKGEVRKWLKKNPLQWWHFYNREYSGYDLHRATLRNGIVTIEYRIYFYYTKDGLYKVVLNLETIEHINATTETIINVEKDFSTLEELMNKANIHYRELMLEMLGLNK